MVAVPARHLPQERSSSFARTPAPGSVHSRSAPTLQREVKSLSLQATAPSRPAVGEDGRQRPARLAGAADHARPASHLAAGSSGVLSLPQAGSAAGGSSPRGRIMKSPRFMKGSLRPSSEGGSPPSPDTSFVISRGTALAAAAFRRLREENADQTAPEQRPVATKGWQVLRSHWGDFVSKRDSVAPRVAVSLSKLNPPPGVPRPGMGKDSFERSMEKLSSPVGDESPRTMARMEKWSKARQMHSELKGQLAQMGWAGPRQPNPMATGFEKTARRPVMNADEAAEAFFPAEWRQLLADVILDAMLPSFADSLLEELATQVEDELRAEPPPPPLPRKHGGHPMSPGVLANVEKRRAVMPLPREPGRPRPVQEDLTLGQKMRQLSPVNDHLKMSSEGFATRSLHGDSANRDPWASHPYFVSPRARVGSQTQILQKSAEQRPRVRLQRKLETVGGPNIVAPMSASHFPDQWEKMTRKRVEEQQTYSPRGSMARTSVERERVTSVSAEKAIETEDMNPTWLIKSDPQGRSIFPYSLAAHRAFIDSQSEDWLREKALEVAPMEFTKWS